MAYVYKITNDINQKIYIGKTEFSIAKRFKEHCRDAFKDRNEKRPLYAAMRKYGIEHFHIELIEETDNPEEREIYWIEYYNSFKNGYNATRGGDGKHYLDYDLIIATYNELQSINLTSQKLNISATTIRSVLKNNKILIISSQEKMRQERGVEILQLNKDTEEIIQSFATTLDAARFVRPNSNSLGGVAGHIIQVCKGQRKTAYGYKWCYR